MGGSALRPHRDPWTVALYEAPRAGRRLGGGVVIDPVRVLTCAHLVSGHSRDRPLWVAFPKAGVPSTVRYQVAAIRSVAEPEVDMAVLDLLAPVPASVTPARLRCPEPADLVGEPWWAFGFPADSALGNDASGIIGTELAYGWVRLDTDSRYVVKQGFSGTGLWSPSFEAVVGLVGQARQGGDLTGDAVALTMHQADRELPEEKLLVLAGWSVAAAGEQALAAWGWSLVTDVEAERHWRPRARGVAVETEAGYRFRGRRAVLSAIVNWLDRPTSDGRVLVVTGSPGVGKSAVLGRVVTTADADVRAALPAEDEAVAATLGSVACAVHAKDKTALDVAIEIARAASVHLPTDLSELIPSLRARLASRPRYRFNVIIDALDEALSPTQARLIIDQIVMPLVAIGPDTGAQVVVGTRRSDDHGGLITLLQPLATIIDLDSPQYFAEDDLTAYALATLQQVGQERPDNPYLDIGTATPVAVRIAQLSGRNFLVAGLVAHRHGFYDSAPESVMALTFPPDIDPALFAYLERIPSIGTASAALILTPLAYAQEPGLPVTLWQAALLGLGVTIPLEELEQFAHTAAANFVLETNMDARLPTYRLFHQALSDAIVRHRHQAHQYADEWAISRALIEHGRHLTWARAETYLLTALPYHAYRANILETLLLDDDYLLHVDLVRFLPLVDYTNTSAGRVRARLLHLTPKAITAAPAERAALFSVTAVLEGLDSPNAWSIGPYQGQWAVVANRREWAVFDGHTDSVSATCTIAINGCSLLASAGADHKIRVWDPTTGQTMYCFEGIIGSVKALCAATVDGRPLVVSGREDGTVCLWDPITGQAIRALRGHTGSIRAVCSITINGQILIASASDDHTIRLWNPATGQTLCVLHGHTGWVRAVCAIIVDNEPLLASASDDRTIRLWDPATGQALDIFEGRTDPIYTICAVTVDGRPLLAGTSDNHRVQVWDPSTGLPLHTLPGHTDWINAICAITVKGRPLLASASNDHTIRLWDPSTGQALHTLRGHTGPINAICATSVNGRALLATGSKDQTIRLWDPAAAKSAPVPDGHTGPVKAICSITIEGQPLLATASDDHTIRLWDPTTGHGLRNFHGHTGPVNAVCAITVLDRPLLATASDDHTIRLWDPTTGETVHTFQGHTGPVKAICSTTIDGRPVIVSASCNAVIVYDPHQGTCEYRRAKSTAPNGLVSWLKTRIAIRRRQTSDEMALAVFSVKTTDRSFITASYRDKLIRLWDPAEGRITRQLEGHTGPVRSICAIKADNETLIVSASDDQTVRLWNPNNARNVRTLKGHTGPVRSVCHIEHDNLRSLASASDDRTVSLWSVRDAVRSYVIPTHFPVHSLASMGRQLIIGLGSGILAVRPTLPE